MESMVIFYKFKLLNTLIKQRIFYCFKYQIILARLCVSCFRDFCEVLMNCILNCWNANKCFHDDLSL